MNDVEDKLAALRDAWRQFQTVAQTTSREQRNAFRDILTEMDQAEAALKRTEVIRLYDQKSAS